MQSFFSGTDTEELLTNADKYYYYLSLIVNFDGNYCAKIAFPSETSEQVITYKSKHGEYKINNNNQIIFTASCDINLETYTPSDFVKQQLEVLKTKNSTKNLFKQQNANNAYGEWIKDSKGNYIRNKIGFNQQTQLP